MKEVIDSQVSSMRDACSYSYAVDEIVTYNGAETFHLIVPGLVDDIHLGIGRARS